MNYPTTIAIIESHQHEYANVVSINEKKDKIASLDISLSNKSFSPEIFSDTKSFSKYIQQQLTDQKALYLVGGYKERREMYSRSELFNNNLKLNDIQNDEPRSVHLGTDIWGKAGTKVHAPIGGVIHSFAFNNNYGDYGPTIILQHQVDTVNFYTLYGHLSFRDLGNLRLGQFIARGEDFAHFGTEEENGNWPPHLHFQLILDIGNYKGDYPGVCKPSETGFWLANSPDPDLILRMNRFISTPSV